MAFWGGPGGTLTVDPSGTPKTLVCHSHQVRKTYRLAENSHSGVSATNFEPIIPHYEWTVRVPWDDTNLPDTDVGLTEGLKVTIKFPDASSGKFKTVTNTSVESIDEEYDSSQNIIMAVISGKGGTLTRQVT